MSMFLGDYAVGVTLDFHFTTRRFTTGAPHTLAGTPVISAYEDNGTTEITAGVTLTADFDARTGLNHVRVVATGGNGFEAGKSYSLVITTGTVDSVSVVGEVVGFFTLERGAAFGRLGAPAGASVSADIAAIKVDTAAILVDTSTTLQAELDGIQADTEDIQARLPTTLVSGRIDASVGAMAAGVVTAAAVATGAIDADALAADAVAEIADGVWDEDATGHQTLGTFGQAIGDPVADAGTIYGRATTIQADTDDIQTRLPAALVGGRMDSSVGAMAAAVVTAAAIATDAIDADALAADAGAEIADAVLDEVVEGAVTLRQSTRLANSANGAKLAGAATTTVTIRDLGDLKNRVTATVDADGNRSAVTLDLA